MLLLGELRRSTWLFTAILATPEICNPMLKSPLPWWLAVALAFVTQSAFGHQPFESTVDVHLRHSRLELKLTLAAQSAIPLAGETALPSLGGDPENLLLKLKEQARGFILISSDQGVSAPILTNAQFSKLGELEAVLVFPEPAPGQVKIEAAYLRQMPLGFGANLTVYDEEENVLATSPHLTRSQPVFTWQWPPSTPPQAQSVPAGLPSPRHSLLYAAVIGLGLAGMLWMTLQRRHAYVRQVMGNNRS